MFMLSVSIRLGFDAGTAGWGWGWLRYQSEFSLRNFPLAVSVDFSNSRALTWDNLLAR